MMGRENIAYIYYSSYNSSQAHGLQIVHTTNALVDKGYGVNLLTAGDIEQFASDNDLDVHSETSFCPISTGQETLDRVGYYTYALYKSRSADVIFTRDISFLKYLSSLPWYPSIPILYEAHKSYAGMGEMSQEEEVNRIHNADLVITQSTGVKKDLESMGVSVRSVVPNAANEDYLPMEYPDDLEKELGITEATTTVVYSGSLYEWKNDIELLIQTATDIQWSDLKVVIVGGDEERIEELKRFIERQDINPDHITFVGRVPHRKVYEYLTIADIGVVPLKSDDPEAIKYTSPIKLFEYLLCDLQIVASSVPAIESISHDNIHRYTPGDNEEMKQAFEAAASADTAARGDKYTYRRRAEQITEILQQDLL